VPGEGHDGVALLTAADEGRRNRRTYDAVLLPSAVLVAPLAATIATSAPAVDADVALGTVLGWAGPAWRAALLGAVLLDVVVVVVVLRQRRALARHLLGTVVLIAAAGAVLGPVVDADWLPVEGGAWSRCGFPEVRVAVAAAVVGVARPELVRPVRVLGVWLVGFAAVGAVALGAALPSGAPGGLGAGSVRSRHRQTRSTAQRECTRSGEVVSKSQTEATAPRTRSIIECRRRRRPTRLRPGRRGR
jgi:hypothetical protein